MGEACRETLISLFPVCNGGKGTLASCPKPVWGQILALENSARKLPLACVESVSRSQIAARARASLGNVATIPALSERPEIALSH